LDDDLGEGYDVIKPIDFLWEYHGENHHFL